MFICVPNKIIERLNNDFSANKKEGEQFLFDFKMMFPNRTPKRIAIVLEPIINISDKNTENIVRVNNKVKP